MKPGQLQCTHIDDPCDHQWDDVCDGKHNVSPCLSEIAQLCGARHLRDPLGGLLVGPRLGVRRVAVRCHDCVGYESEVAVHTVLVGTAGGEHAALISPDIKYVQRIVQAINDAIIARG